MIGDPATRYREDPVRIIRAVRFAAKLGAWVFRSSQRPQPPLVKSHELLADVPQSRCSTRCSSCCKPAIRWPRLSS
jgi:poly(A) polymerase